MYGASYITIYHVHGWSRMTHRLRGSPDTAFETPTVPLRSEGRPAGAPPQRAAGEVDPQLRRSNRAPW